MTSFYDLENAARSTIDTIEQALFLGEKVSPRSKEQLERRCQELRAAINAPADPAPHPRSPSPAQNTHLPFGTQPDPRLKVGSP